MYADIVDRAARDREHFWSGATVFWDTHEAPAGASANLPGGTAPGGAARQRVCSRASYLQPDSFNVVRSFLEPFDAAHPGQDVLTRMIYNEFKLRLPELLLMRVDKIGMSTSIEARVPFLDHELVEFTMDIPMARQDPRRDGEAPAEAGGHRPDSGRDHPPSQDGLRRADGAVAAG